LVYGGGPKRESGIHIPDETKLPGEFVTMLKEMNALKYVSSFTLKCDASHFDLASPNFESRSGYTRDTRFLWRWRLKSRSSAL